MSASSGMRQRIRKVSCRLLNLLEAHRKERKRRRNDLKDKVGSPFGPLKPLGPPADQEATMFRIADFADLKQKAQAGDTCSS